MITGDPADPVAPQARPSTGKCSDGCSDAGGETSCSWRGCERVATSLGRDRRLGRPPNRTGGAISSLIYTSRIEAVRLAKPSLWSVRVRGADGVSLWAGDRLDASHLLTVQHRVSTARPSWAAARCSPLRSCAGTTRPDPAAWAVVGGSRSAECKYAHPVARFASRSHSMSVGRGRASSASIRRWASASRGRVTPRDKRASTTASASALGGGSEWRQFERPPGRVTAISSRHATGRLTMMAIAAAPRPLPLRPRLARGRARARRTRVTPRYQRLTVQLYRSCRHLITRIAARATRAGVDDASGLCRDGGLGSAAGGRAWGRRAVALRPQPCADGRAQRRRSAGIVPARVISLLVSPVGP